MANVAFLGGNVEQGLFNATAFFYLLSSCAYFTYLAVRKSPVGRLGFFAAAAGVLAETAALALRWKTAGWDHPPFTNMYESLVFFAWGIVVVYLIVEMRTKIRLIGAFVVPVAFAAMGLASLSPNKAITPLVPALQSIWLHLHVATASIGYAAFLVAFGLSMLYLIRDRLPLLQMFASCSVVNVAGILAVTRGGAPLLKFPLNAATRINGQVEKIYIPGTDPPLYEQVAVAGLGWLICLTMVAFVAAALVAAGQKPDSSGKAFGKGWRVFQGATALFLVTLAALVFELVHNPLISIRVNPYSFALLATLGFFSLTLCMVNQVHGAIVSLLPSPRKLDELTYRAIMVAFPIMTLVILTGAIWANKAWGRYWGWDPKETASLITWIIYLIYLHTRITQGWAGRRSAYISIIGFVSVVFTYLGVNLLLSGLHAYAKG